MKKHITILSAVLLAGSTIFTSCKKDDVTAPVVTLNGGDETMSLQGTFVDMGASANDNKDGNLATSVSGNVDVNHTGTYQLTYTATDAAGNSATATRNVTVVNDLDGMTGVYTCVINPGAYTYTQTVTASSTVNKRLNFGKFGDYTGNTGIYADVNNTGTTSPISLPSQTAIQVGSPATDRTFSGTGARVSQNSFGLSYTETTSTGSASYTEAYTKQ
ncbi:MAG: immunoglobulin-like domain-containing protein [Bacteroidota bacterium]